MGNLHLRSSLWCVSSVAHLRYRRKWSLPTRYSPPLSGLLSSELLFSRLDRSREKGGSEFKSQAKLGYPVLFLLGFFELTLFLCLSMLLAFWVLGKLLLRWNPSFFWAGLGFVCGSFGIRGTGNLNSWTDMISVVGAKGDLRSIPNRSLERRIIPVWFMWWGNLVGLLLIELVWLDVLPSWIHIYVAPPYGRGYIWWVWDPQARNSWTDCFAQVLIFWNKCLFRISSGLARSSPL